jgi:hypothetical protein
MNGIKYLLFVFGSDCFVFISGLGLKPTLNSFSSGRSLDKVESYECLAIPPHPQVLFSIHSKDVFFAVGYNIQIHVC